MNLPNNMNFYKNLTLLQNLAQLIDTGKASELESQSFDALLELLNEQNKNRHATSKLAHNYNIRDGLGKRLDVAIC
jgi:hypothetical protein